MTLQKSVLALAVSAIISQSAFAETQAADTSQTADQSKEKSNTVVIVKDKKDDNLSTTTTLTQEDIAATPSGNGNLTDYLKHEPGVRYGTDTQNGVLNGEIRPAEISIHGADPNQTAYLIDGINVNNDIGNISELSSVGEDARNMPGKSSGQGYFVDPAMVGKVEVYTSNVPANVGGFTGGAVVAETLKYSGIDRTRIRLRTTRSSWASMKVDKNAEKLFDRAMPRGDKSEFQPHYRKEFLSLVTERGLTDDLGMTFGVSRRQSRIRQNQVINKEGAIANTTQKRFSDNILTNFSWTPDEDRSLDFGLRYSSYREDRHFGEVAENNFTNEHQAYGATLKWTQRLGTGSFTATATYDNMHDDKDSNSNHAEVESIDGNDYTLGGYGDSRVDQQSYQLKLAYALDTFQWGGMEHHVSTGVDYQYNRVQFERFEAATQRVTTIVPPIPPFFPGLRDVSESEALAGRVGINYHREALFAENQIAWGDWKFRPGIRVEKDNYLGHTNIAPRFATSWQALPDTRFDAGVNRYYGRSFATMKLADKVSVLNKDEARDFNSLKGLKTPFSDEIMFGVHQILGDYAISARYVQRHYKDRIVTEETRITPTPGSKATKLFVYKNGRTYKNETYTLQISNTKPWIVGPTQWTGTLGADYITHNRSDLSKDLDPNQEVILDGKLTTRRGMEEEVNSSDEKWTARLGLDMAIPKYRLKWTNRVYFKGPAEGYQSVDDRGNIEKFESFDYGTQTQWDTRLRMDIPVVNQQTAYVQFEVLNVLNKTRRIKLQANSGKGDYYLHTPGRELWVEVGYQF